MVFIETTGSPVAPEGRATMLGLRVIPSPMAKNPKRPCYLLGSQRTGAGTSRRSKPQLRMPRAAMTQPPDATLRWTTAIHCSGLVFPSTNLGTSD
jgi:hypothetical protein